ncbi:MAG: alpha-2-macroglobulin, partial [Gemmataceae bacterium]|nr:alpha-2-macroglobulin [Gemmataceae bacterium]
TLHVGAYARGVLIAHQKVTLEAGKELDVALVGDEKVGGVTRITVFEEVKDDADRTLLRPRAERLIFRTQGEFLTLNATPDKARYTPSDKVRLDLSSLNEKGKPAPAVLMVGVVNRSVVTMADNKNDRLLPTHFLLSGEVKNSAELEHADFLLTKHPQAAHALDLLLGTQGWRRFAEQEQPPADPADRPAVNAMLIAHGMRPTAPLELQKLEAQRVNAEYTPQLEQARLNAARKEIEWEAASPGANPAFIAAQAALTVATAQQVDAAASQKRYEQWFANRRYDVLPLFVLGVVLVGAFVFFNRLLAVNADEPTAAGRATPADGDAPTRRGRPLLAAACVLGVFVLLGAVALLGMQSKREAAVGLNDSFAMKSRELDRVWAERAPMSPAGGRLPNEDIGFNGELPPGGRPEPGQKSDANRPGARPRPDLSALRGHSIAREWYSREPLADRKPLVAVDKSQSMRLAPGSRPRVTVAFNPDGTRTGWLADQDLAVVDVWQQVLPQVVREYAHQRDPALGEVRSDFTETVFWQPVLVLPESGKASVQFQLSDDVARYQVLVAGHTLDGRVGAFTTTIEARKPFSLDPKLPLEISHTDTIDAPIRVTNDGDNARSVGYKVTAPGFKMHGPVEESFDLSPNGKGRKLLRLTADQLQGEASVLVE